MNPEITVVPARTADRRHATSPEVTVVPVLDGDRQVGAWLVGPDTATYRPVVDVTRLAGAALATAAAVTIATARRPPPGRQVSILISRARTDSRRSGRRSPATTTR